MRALVHGLWERPDLDLDAMDAFAPDQAAYAIVAEDQRSRLRELMVLLELCPAPGERGAGATRRRVGKTATLALADVPLEDVRAHFGVPPLPA